MPKNKGQGKAMTPSAAAQIQSSQARNGGDMSSGGFAARAQSAAARNENSGYSSFGHQTTNKQGAGNGSTTGSGQGKK
ncbi:hypothetical protein O1611_g6948 [Lasiodiplodia mahajangana]|uniref:Uncharacterized protein n=1 Tax=Lasiodiplodia mahajangana TaxID=1108764 RepID=A0ACC2JGU5_9PEZI|nr:hypothetical protein O1611_g6948 [Lasiodiplodia mahajangana]